MIITIDGPAGTGKSSVAHQVAQRLGCEFLDTGAMYRAVALEALRRGADLSDAPALALAARRCRIDFDWSVQPPEVLLNGAPVSSLLRGGEVTRAASHVAVVPEIREQLVRRQRRIGHEHGRIVTEGRDQGSVVFPDADFKFYLDATPQERCRRRVAQLHARGEVVDPDRVLEEILSRDARDASRAVGPLVVPAGAAIIDTTRLSQEQVIGRIVSAVQGGRP